MENTERYTDKLAKYIIIAVCICLGLGLCWLLKSVLAYIIIAAVISLIAKPVMNFTKKINIKGRTLPSWFLAIVSLTLTAGVALTILSLIIPLVSSIVQDVSVQNISQAVKGIAVPLADLNNFLQERFTNLGENFRIEVAIGQEITKLINVDVFSNAIGSAASVLTNLFIGLFAVAYISFFFIKDDGLFTKLVCALVPDKHEKTVEKAIDDIEHLLSRYFVGITIEVLGVALINFLGLWLIARLNINAALGIGFLTGIFIIIPYIGPLIGISTGTILGLILKYSSAVPVGLDLEFWSFGAVLLSIMCTTQLIDTFFYQPLIYSTSIKSKPLEIFIVLLIVGNIGGPLAMIVAIPVYTVFRVIAFRFFRHVKAFRRLIPSEKLISEE